MALDQAGPLARRSADEARPRLGADDSFIYSQDVKCFLCGFVSGQLVGPPTLPRSARAFRPAPGYVTPADFSPVRPRCLRCGGGCFLDEVEATLQLREEDIEKPRRGRKPKRVTSDQ